MYNFKRLIKKYSKTPPKRLTVTGDGYYDYENGGEWVPATGTWSEFEGAIVPMNSDDLEYRENNPYTSQDRKLYTYVDIPLNEKIQHRGNEYTVQERIDYSEYDTDLRIYYLRKGV